MRFIWLLIRAESSLSFWQNGTNRSLTSTWPDMPLPNGSVSSVHERPCLNQQRKACQCAGFSLLMEPGYQSCMASITAS